MFLSQLDTSPDDDGNESGESRLFAAKLERLTIGGLALGMRGRTGSLIEEFDGMRLVSRKKRCPKKTLEGTAFAATDDKPTAKPKQPKQGVRWRDIVTGVGWTMKKAKGCTAGDGGKTLPGIVCLGVVLPRRLCHHPFQASSPQKGFKGDVR